MLRLTFRNVPCRANRSIPSTLARSLSVSKRYLATDGSVKSFIPKVQTFGDKTIENNLKTDTNRLSKTLAKFWEKVDTVHTDGKYEVQLDGKALRTPAGFPLALPESKKQLAYLVAHEWANLPNLKIQTSSLPLTSIVSRAIDLQMINENNDQVTEETIVKVGNLEDVKVNMLRYLDTDTCLIFAPKSEYEGRFRARQDELYLPLIAEYEDFFTHYARKNNLLPDPCSKITLEYLDTEVDGLRGNKQTLLTQNVVFHWLGQIPVADLVALEKAILTTKSFLCGVSLLRSHSTDPEVIDNVYQINKSSPDSHFFTTVDDLVELGNLEIIFQTARWGEVDDTHDVDKEDWLRNLTSAAILCR
ncbi:ATP12-domain-containing protein [Suhomyces tanzawaensis NRRL Y-17324]|uniref:ATP12-domain-containing protein n=1 Tax=Suhomyces tanzawaensis NRRL Y-17324 TaxID=984487 RepID=A0A1E4SD39_9ASCO|nr:ATP12-domain-containing protein [Suhomyces tanzawaensis NRRL Y-17324]ODV77430.1 ATP12-domain-containing protein [Suhomyces tanzawaensis NRRL Y-17324]